MKKIASNAVVSACSQRVGALKKYLGAKDELFVGGEQVKTAALVQMYQAALDTRATAVTAKGAYKSSLAARDAAEAKRLAADAALQPYVEQRFGVGSTEAHDFGYASRKAAEKSAVSKAKAALLNKATRDARGTMGAKAKQQIKGTLSPATTAALGVLSGSAASAAAPSPAAASAVASMPVVAAAPSALAAANGATLNGAAHS